MAKRLILVGCGAFARELINWAEDVAHADKGQEVSGFLDTNPNALDGYPYDLPWLGDIDTYLPGAGDELLMAIGDPAGKRMVASKLKARGAVFASLIHPTAVVARSARLGEGVVICPQAFVSADARLGDFVAVNGLSSVGHDVSIGDYSTLSAHVDLTGYVQVGEGVFFGTGAKVIPKVKIGDGAKIGAGAIVMRSVPDNAVMYAPPAKRL